MRAGGEVPSGDKAVAYPVGQIGEFMALKTVATGPGIQGLIDRTSRDLDRIRGESGTGKSSEAQAETAKVEEQRATKTPVWHLPYQTIFPGA